MNIEELMQSLPSREDIANAVGWQSRRGFGRGFGAGSNSEMLPALGLFGTGMLFGAGLALLFAPRSGSEMRRELSEKAQEFGSQAKGMVENMGYGSEQGQHHAASGQSGQHSSTSGQGGSTGQRGGIGGSSGGRTV